MAVTSNSATTPMMPIFSSDQAIERVRGMATSGKESFQIFVVRRAQLLGRAFKCDAAVLEHQKLGQRGALRRRWRESQSLAVTLRLMGRDVKRIPQLVR